jgi:hypothetical protein
LIIHYKATTICDRRHPLRIKYKAIYPENIAPLQALVPIYALPKINKDIVIMIRNLSRSLQSILYVNKKVCHEGDLL